jgi:hypothetical protein
MRWVLGTGGLAAVLSAGCLDGPGSTHASNALDGAPRVVPRAAVANPASTEASARVDTLGRRLLAANPQAGARPLFITVGVPDPELFHRGTEDIYITEGLVRLCPADGPLAGLLALELAEAVSEREAAAAPASLRQPDRLPPMRVDPGGGFSGRTPDQTELAELGRYDADRRKRQQAPPRPDPRKLAAKYLVNAGFREEELDAAASLRETARASNKYEKQLLGAAPTPRVEDRTPAPPPPASYPAPAPR